VGLHKCFPQVESYLGVTLGGTSRAVPLERVPTGWLPQVVPSGVSPRGGGQVGDTQAVFPRGVTKWVSSKGGSPAASPRGPPGFSSGVT
jgi:hypothetical protein